MPVDEPAAQVDRGLGQREHVVILVHGINTQALWQNEISHTLRKRDLIPRPIGYDVYGVIRFLFPSRRLRNDAIEEITRLITDVRRQYPAARISFIAHSFGAYIVVEFLRRHYDFKLCRLILCGSVVPRKFRFADIADRFEDAADPDEKIVNDCGTYDVWPIMAQSLNFAYGASGTFGFTGTRVRNRWHDYFRHSDFLTEKFCVTYWISFLRDGQIKPGAKRVQSIPLYMRALSRISLKHVIPTLALLAGLCWWVHVPPDSYVIEAGENGIGYANSMMSFIRAKLENSPRAYCPIDCLLGYRTAVVAAIATEDLARLAVRGNFDCRRCYPLEALEKFERTFPTCLKVSRLESGQLTIDLNPAGVEAWIDPESSVRWRVCKVRTAN